MKSNQLKTFIQNRKGLKMTVVVERNPNSKGLAFVMHGLGGWKDQSHIQTFAQAFRDNDFTVVLFDTTNSFGESEGNYEDASTTNYYEDLEDIIEWASHQEWYQEPFWLAGHSLGGLSTALYGEKYPDKVKALAPISTVVSGKLSLETRAYRIDLENWKKTGWLIKESSSKPGLTKKLKYAEAEDRLKYDLLTNAHRLTMPVLLIVGDKDEGTPTEHQKVLFDKLPGKKELHVIKNAPHTFKDPSHLTEIRNLFDKWIKENL
jgi:pimeloyl-ACP methyl ester carboxylesterase